VPKLTFGAGKKILGESSFYDLENAKYQFYKKFTFSFLKSIFDSVMINMIHDHLNKA